MTTPQDSDRSRPGSPPPSPLLLKESNDTLREFQLILAAMGKDDRRKVPEFQTLMAQYKLLGTKLHEARQRLPPPPPPAKAAPIAPHSVTALSRAQPVHPVAQPAAQVSALGRARQAYGATVGATAPLSHQASAPQQVAPEHPAAAQSAEVPAPAPPIHEIVESAPLAPPELPLTLPKFTGTLGPPGTKCIDAGPPVANLQKLLVVLGYKVQVTGEYDVRTFRSVQELQKEHKLPVTGIIGLETRKLLNEMVTG